MKYLSTVKAGCWHRLEPVWGLGHRGRGVVRSIRVRHMRKAQHGR
jgi:hypothetical protein